MSSASPNSNLQRLYKLSRSWSSLDRFMKLLISTCEFFPLEFWMHAMRSLLVEVLMILLLPLTLLYICIYTCWSTVGGIHWNCWVRDRSGMVAGGFTAGVVPVLQVLLQVLLRLLQTTEVRHSPLRFLLLATSHPCSSPLAHRLVCVWIPLLLLNLPAYIKFSSMVVLCTSSLAS